MQGRFLPIETKKVRSLLFRVHVSHYHRRNGKDDFSHATINSDISGRVISVRPVYDVFNHIFPITGWLGNHCSGLPPAIETNNNINITLIQVYCVGDCLIWKMVNRDV